MVRKIFSGILIVLGILLFVSSLIAVGAIWFYKDRLTNEAVTQLKGIEAEIAQAQIALQSSAGELERALRIVDTAQNALQKLSLQSNSAESLLDNIQSTLDDRVLPELKTTRGRIGTARTALENLQSVLAGIRSFLPNIDLSSPDKIVTDLIDSTKSLDDEIANVEKLVQQASTFVSDNSYILGGDLGETRDSLQNLLDSVKAYEDKVNTWHEQVEGLIEKAPTWIDRTAVGLTIFLLWFAVSQFGLFLHGLNVWNGGNPFVMWRRERGLHTSLIREDDEIEPI